MIAKEKIVSVTQYLKGEFPDFEIDDAMDFDRVSWKFRAVKGDTIYIVKFERRFWDDTSDIRKTLQDLGLSKFMKENEGKHVLVTTRGPTVLNH